MQQTSANKLLWFFAGASIGAAAGIVFAPARRRRGAGSE